MTANPANRLLTVLSLCDETGNWPKFYREAGYDVVCVDLKNSGDVLMHAPAGRIHGILAAPPCTVFAYSGNRWPRTEAQILHALSVVDACLRLVTVCKPKWWALENSSGKLTRYLGAPAVYFQPCDYGDPWTKKTALWGNFVVPDPLWIGGDKAVPPTEGSKFWIKYGGRSERVKALKSATPLGFAEAFFRANP